MDFMPEGPMAIPLWVNGRAYLTVTDEFFNVSHPVTQEITRRVPLCGLDEAAQTVQAARAAELSWAGCGVMARQTCLGQLADALEKYRGHFAKLLRSETALDDEASVQEVQLTVDGLRSAKMGCTGVSALILDANVSFSRAVAQVAATLLAGGTLVIKPSPKMPATLFALCELTGRCEWPAGVINLLQGDVLAIEGLVAQTLDAVMVMGGEETVAAVTGLANRFERHCDVIA